MVQRPDENQKRSETELRAAAQINCMIKLIRTTGIVWNQPAAPFALHSCFEENSIGKTSIQLGYKFHLSLCFLDLSFLLGFSVGSWSRSRLFFLFFFDSEAFEGFSRASLDPAFLSRNCLDFLACWIWKWENIFDELCTEVETEPSAPQRSHDWTSGWQSVGSHMESKGQRWWDQSSVADTKVAFFIASCAAVHHLKDCTSWHEVANGWLNITVALAVEIMRIESLRGEHFIKLSILALGKLLVEGIVFGFQSSDMLIQRVHMPWQQAKWDRNLVLASTPAFLKWLI